MLTAGLSSFCSVQHCSRAHSSALCSLNYRLSLSGHSPRSSGRRHWEGKRVGWLLYTVLLADKTTFSCLHLSLHFQFSFHVFTHLLPTTTWTLHRLFVGICLLSPSLAHFLSLTVCSPLKLLQLCAQLCVCSSSHQHLTAAALIHFNLNILCSLTQRHFLFVCLRCLPVYRAKVCFLHCWNTVTTSFLLDKL